MSTSERTKRLPADLLQRLSDALAAGAPDSAIVAALSPCALPRAMADQVAERARLIGERARQRDLRASAAEVQLALGVMLVLAGAHALNGSAAAS